MPTQYHRLASPTQAHPGSPRRVQARPGPQGKEPAWSRAGPARARRPRVRMRPDMFSRRLRRVICWICGNSAIEFLDYGIPARPGRCPHCGAKPRNRAVYWYLKEVVRPALAAGDEVLEIGSSRVSARYLCSESLVGDARCTLIDVRDLDFHARIEPPHRFLCMDVTDIALPDDSFDLILCNNTLPYVRDDREALGEIFRCLKPDGLAMLDSSHDLDRTRSVDAYRREHPELGDDYFAENGDQWVYGKDYIERIEAAGFQVRVDELFSDRTAGFKARHGLKPHHSLVVAFKSPRGSARYPPPESRRAEAGRG